MMHSHDVKRAANSKSRIPVLVAAVKPTHFTNKGGDKNKKISATNLQKLNKNISVNSCFLHKEPTKKSDSKSKNSNNHPTEKTVSKSKSGLQSSRTNLKHDVYKNENKNNKKASSNRSEKCDTFKKETNAKCTLEKNKTVSDNVGKKLPVSKRNTFHEKKEVKVLTPRNLNEKQYLSSNQELFSSQKDIKFEGNEFFRNMILSNRELSPSIMQRMPSLRLSTLQDLSGIYTADHPKCNTISIDHNIGEAIFCRILAQRPSAYQKMELSANPFKEAIEAIENVCLSAKRNGKIPFKDKLPLSPFKDRPSFYTPYTNPKDEVMNSLKQLKLQRLQKTLPKSTKKVTFNLNIQECSPIRTSMTNNTEEISECRLTQIDENSKENTPLSPHMSNTEFEPSENCDSIEETKTNGPTKSESKGSPILTKNINCTPGTVYTDSKLPSVSKDVAPDEQPTENQTAATMPKLEQRNTNSLHVASVKIYTPKPISLFAKSKIIDSGSPEFLASGKSAVIAKYAPICTPLVLKSIAKNMCSPEANHLSPVRLKLDFAEVDRGTPRNNTPRKKTVVTLENIETLQKKLDDLADQECFLLLLDENTSVVCGRYLTNPLAQILSEGDDMHFIPIQL